MELFVWELCMRARLHTCTACTLWRVCVYCSQITLSLQIRLHGRPKASICIPGASKQFIQVQFFFFKDDLVLKLPRAN